MSDLYEEDNESGYDDDYLSKEEDDIDEDALDTLAQEFPELDDGGENSEPESSNE